MDAQSLESSLAQPISVLRMTAETQSRLGNWLADAPTVRNIEAQPVTALEHAGFSESQIGEIHSALQQFNPLFVGIAGYKVNQ